MTPLSQMLVVEHLPQRRTRTSVGAADLAVPAMCEVRFDLPVEPILATNMRGMFVATRRSKLGIARFGFSTVPVDDEPAFLSKLYRTLVLLSIKDQWKNRCATAAEALKRMESFKFEPKIALLSKLDLEENAKDVLAGIDAGDMTVLPVDLPKGAALITTVPSLVGRYTRVGNHLGILIQSVDRTIMVVGHGLD